jgi:hypothetical protein
MLKHRHLGKLLTPNIQWVIADKEKFNTLLRGLKDYNKGLEKLFPPSRQAGYVPKDKEK